MHSPCAIPTDRILDANNFSYQDWFATMGIVGICTEKFVLLKIIEFTCWFECLLAVLKESE